MEIIAEMTHKYKKYVLIGYKEDGSPRRVWVYADSKEEMADRIYEIKHNSKEIPSLNDVTFQSYAKKFVDTYKANKSPSTKQMYSVALNKCHDINMIKMKDIRRTHLQSVINKCEGANTARKTAMVLMQIMKAAAVDGIISYPAWKLELPKYKTPEKAFLSDRELEAVLAVDLPQKEELFVLLEATFGLRPQETLALTKSDLKGKYIKIDKAIRYDGNVGSVSGTKNGSVRTLPIPTEVQKKIKGLLPQMEENIFFRDGHPLTKTVAESWKRSISQKIGISNIYVLRHSVGTKLYYKCCENKLSFKMAAELMGHSEKVFLDTYSHIDKTKEDLDEIFG